MSPLTPAPEIIVKFHDVPGAYLEGDRGTLKSNIIPLANFESALRGKRVYAYPSFPRFGRYLSRARHPRGSRPPSGSLSLFARVRMIAAATEDQVGALLRDLKGVPEVDYAVRAHPPAKSPEAPPIPNLRGLQNYHAPAADGGVDSEAAWAIEGGNGESVRVAVCDMGVRVTHEDLIHTVELLYPPLEYWERHGTKVMGIMAGSNEDPQTVNYQNQTGVVGICHGGEFKVANFQDIPENDITVFATETEPDLRSARILKAIDDVIMDYLLYVGARVLVLEVAYDYQDVVNITTAPNPEVPAEANPDVHTMIREASLEGIVVVEAAGNGHTKLDDVQVYESTTGDLHTIWNEPWGHPEEASIHDSFAVLVGGGNAPDVPPPREKQVDSNYGKRLTCQGWGNHVFTTCIKAEAAYGHDYGDDRSFTDSFGGTSAATAIVGGVVAALQGAYQRVWGHPLDPWVVRELLSNPAYGTPQPDTNALGLAVAGTNAADYPIGPLPDLGALLHVCADVYMRDMVGDEGEEPSSGPILYRSPDIILRRDPSPDPVTEFGEGSWDEDDLSETAEQGKNAYIYVRMSNRGTYADDARVTLYWSHPSTFIHPSDWNEIGSRDVQGVGPGEHRVSPNPIIWQGSTIPAAGHYCLIAVVQTAHDLVDVPTALTEAGSFTEFVRTHNNICYRNIQVVEAEEGAVPPIFAFVVRGLPKLPGVGNKPDRFRLKIYPRLPRDAGLVVKAPEPLRVHWPGTGRPVALARPAPRSPLEHESSRPIVLDNLLLKPGENVPIEIEVRNARPGNYLVHADQYWGNRHLGRVNYLIKVHPAAKAE